jgi:hypothetical protein
MNNNSFSESERKHWFEFWHYGYFANKEMTNLFGCLNLANQLDLNGAGFDLHIQSVSPQISGGLTTTIGGFSTFDDLGQLKILLANAVMELRDATNATSKSD